MKRLIILLSITTLAISACKKDNDEPGNGCTTGEVTVFNNTNDSYLIYFNELKYADINPMSNHTYTLNPGAYTMKAVQADGYIFYPTIYYSNLFINECDKHSVSFP